jgi:hypothetical protein
MSSGCPAAGFPMATVLAWVPLFSVPLSGHKLPYKAPFPLDRHIRGICPRFASDPFVEEGLARCDWWRPCVAGVTPVSSLCRSCRDPATFNKVSVKVLSSSPARASDGEDVCRLLAQPVPWSKSASSAGHRGDSWDVSRQTALPLAYPDSHSHDTSPRNWRSLIGKHGASAGSISR